MKQKTSYWLLLLLCFHLGIAQETSLKHTVASDESLSDIAQRYNVTLEDIHKLNPSAINGIQENDILVISKPSTSSTLNSQPLKYTVQPGDTKYSLAKRFEMTITELESLNPQIVPMLKVGEVLQIGGSVEEINDVQEDMTYVVKSGDTKYGLSKKFGISIDQLEIMNPQIVPELLVGQTVSLSNNSSVPAFTTEIISVSSNDEAEKDNVEKSNNELENSLEKNTSEEDNREAESVTYYSNPNINYTIKPGETLYGLSKAAGITIEELIALNPKLSTSVQAGMVIKMPSADSSIGNNSAFGQVKTVKLTSSYTDLSQSLILDKSKNLMFFLPFSLKEFSDKNLDADNLSESVKNNRDFFRGALIAMDSAKSLGLKFQFNIVNIGDAKLSSDLVAKAEKANVNSFDAMILPFYEKSVQDLASVVNENIPVVTTSNLYTDKETPNLFEAIPSINAQRKVMLDYLASKDNSNIIVINDENRAESRAFISDKTPKARFVQVKENGIFNAEDLVGMLQKNAKNYIVLDTDKNGVFISATNTLLKEMSNYSIQLVVLESSLIPDEIDVSRKRFVILNLLYPSFTSVSSMQGEKAFRALYKKQYNSEPVTMSRYGFDITFDTLLRLFQLDSFETVSMKTTEYNSLRFKYFKNEQGYYSNSGVSIFQFEADDTHRQVK